MIRKYKIYIIMGITVLLLFMVLPVDTKGDWEIPWDITLEGEGNDPAFRSSTVMEIFLKMGQHQGYYSFRESTENKSDLGLRTKYTDQFSGRRDL